MLRLRIATAAVLLAILLPAIFLFQPWVWGLCSLLFLALGLREWALLLGSSSSRATGAALLMCVLGGAIVALPGQPELMRWGSALAALATLFWLVMGPWRLKRGEVRGGGVTLALVLMLGCWISLYLLRIVGVWALLSSMAVVWVADVAAYFAGRAWGRRKLAPSISPGKSWEGAIGGFLAVVAIGLLLAWMVAWNPALSTTLPARLVAEFGAAGAGLILVALAALSIVGDLHESLLKRQAGVKDSGTLLPGHGGVLDRIDALIPVMPAALLLFSLME